VAGFLRVLPKEKSPSALSGVSTPICHLLCEMALNALFLALQDFSLNSEFTSDSLCQLFFAEANTQASHSRIRVAVILYVDMGIPLQYIGTKFKKMIFVNFIK
jgi:hypothetical protein